MDKKLFRRLKKSMQQHARIARGELATTRVTSRELSSDEIDPELRASIARGLSDADAGRLVPVEDLMKEFGIDESEKARE
jgi:predicted transcriptional regulator